MEKLKPCPFCGGKASIDEITANPFSNEDESMWAVGCEKCNIGWYKETEAEAIATWNRRAAPENKYEDILKREG